MYLSPTWTEDFFIHKPVRSVTNQVSLSDCIWYKFTTTIIQPYYPILLCFAFGLVMPFHDIYRHIAVNFNSPMAKPESCLIVKIRHTKKDTFYLCQYDSNSYSQEIEKVKSCNHNSLTGKSHFLIMTDRVISGSPQFPLNRNGK